MIVWCVNCLELKATPSRKQFRGTKILSMHNLVDPIVFSERAMKRISIFSAQHRHHLFALLSVLCINAMWSIDAHAQNEVSVCGSIANHYGPYDYRTERDKLKIVEEFHFTPEVEALIRGKSGWLEGDIAYTLHTSPNHHRALMAMARLAEKMKTSKLPHAAYSVGCYFDRAIRFRPDDTVVRVLYAQFLAKNGKPNESVQQLDIAVDYAKDNAFSHYNIGLAYFDIGQFDKALAQAHKAAAMGFDRTELAGLLKGVKKWQEPIN